MISLFINKEEALRKKLVKTLQLSGESKNASNKKYQKVAILTTNDVSQVYDLKRLVSETLELTDCTVFSYQKFNKGEEMSYECFSEKDILKRGTVVGENLKHFLSQSFDLLITIIDSKNVYLEFVTALTTADCKAGFSDVNSDLFDIEVKIEISEIDQFLSELKKYLIILNKL